MVSGTPEHELLASDQAITQIFPPASAIGQGLSFRSPQLMCPNLEDEWQQLTEMPSEFVDVIFAVRYDFTTTVYAGC